MTLPLVSAIVAAYNYERFLPRTLDSALAQDYPADRLEIVVVDDGSTDGTPELLAEYGARYPGRVRTFRQENAGYVAATNRAFAEARGALWALLDADDLWSPEKTARQVEVFRSRPEVGMVYSDLAVIDAEDRVVQPSHWRELGLSPVRGPGALASLLVTGNVATASSIMVRASLRERFAPVPDGVGYVDWWVAVQSAAAAELEYISEPHVGYRHHGANLTLRAEGVGLSRELIKAAMTRRLGLIHGGAAALPVESLAAAWTMVEHEVLQAVEAAGTAFIELPQVSPQARAAAREAAARARALGARGRTVQALRLWLLAAAQDPFDNEARAAIRALADSLARGAGPLAAARSFIVLADVAELGKRPQLLAAFAERFGADDDATLVIHAPGMSPEQTERLLTVALDAAGVDAATGADMLAVPDPECAVSRAELARFADALLREDGFDALRARYEEAGAPFARAAR